MDSNSELELPRTLKNHVKCRTKFQCEAIWKLCKTSFVEEPAECEDNSVHKIKLVEHKDSLVMKLSPSNTRLNSQDERISLQNARLT